MAIQKINQKDEGEITFRGVAASPGLAYGPAFVFFQKELDVPVYNVLPHAHSQEINRFEDALLKTRIEINNLKAVVTETLGAQEAQIFDAHLLVLEDKALIDETIRELTKTSYNIDFCFHAVSRRYVQAFDNIDDEYIKERSADIRDVSRRVLQKLLGENQLNSFRFNEEKIIVSEDLSPSNVAEIPKETIIAILTNRGSRTSHAVIIARSLQIPAVVGLHDITKRIQSGHYLIVDGYEGLVIANPSKATIQKYGQIKIKHQNVQHIFEASKSLITQTKDRIRVGLMINIESHEEVKEVNALGADGVGLYRTEALFLRSEQMPSEQTQFVAYKNIVSRMGRLPTTIRTIDLGGDKRLSNFFITHEEVNPFMGFRAIRLCLEHPELFKAQLKAILRASAYGKTRLMYPMVTSESEIVQANEILKRAKEELSEQKLPFDDDIAVGIMIETPSAALTIDLLAKHCTFFSIGTNDLIQYTLAVDRVNDRIAHLYQPYHPSVIRLLKMIVTEALKRNVEVSVCGEMAGDALFVPLLLGLGVQSLSVTPTVLPEIKYVIRSTKLSEANDLAQKALETKTPEATLQILREFYLKTVGEILTK